MSKPFYKRPLFWALAPLTLVVVLVLDVAQLGVGAVWLKTRADAMRPAEKTPPTLARYGNLPAMRTVAPYNAKPGEWQVPRPDPSVLDTAPPQVTLVPTKFGPGAEVRGGWGMRQETKAIGIAMTPRFIVQSAYGWKSSTRMIFPDQMPNAQYDFIANLPTGALEGLQQEVKKKLGLVAERETRPMDVLLMRVHHADAPGLKKVTGSPTFSGQNEPGVMRFPYGPIENFASYLESVLGRPVIDQTGLTGNFDVTFRSVRRTGPNRSTEWIDQSRQAIQDQLGLELVSTNAPTEILVVKKVNP
jgi:uncharacterized protein (TIGR03435 family)